MTEKGAQSDDQMFFAIAERKFQDRLREELRVQAAEDPNARDFSQIQRMFHGYGVFLETHPEALMQPPSRETA